LEKLEEERIRQVLSKAPSLVEAVGVPGIDPTTLYRKRKKLGLDWSPVLLRLNRHSARAYAQTLGPLRSVKTSPAAATMAPPTTNQMALSVGEPVKNFDTSEVNDVAALMPKMSKMMPPHRSAMAIGLFI
jgi:hypothetical protein